MATVDRATRQAWSANPRGGWTSIHVSGDVAERATARARGCKVTRTFRLTAGIRCT